MNIPAAYMRVAKELESYSITTHINPSEMTPLQMVCSTGEFSNGPFKSSSIWIAQSGDTWYVATWAPRIYRAPLGTDIARLCSDILSKCIETPSDLESAVKKRYGLTEVDDIK